MKSIKKILAAATFCAATVVSYNMYNNATMTEEQRLIKANLEALSDYELTVDDYSNCKYSDKETCVIEKEDQIWDVYNMIKK